MARQGGSAEVVSELVLRVVSSVVAALVVLFLTGLFGSISPLAVSGSIVIAIIAAVSFQLWLRARRLSVPGLRSWLRDRAMEDYSYRLLQDARHSFEVMGATGSSVFAQSGKFLNTLSEKYAQNSSFVVRVLLIDPDARELIEYRRRSLGTEPHALDASAIRSTINLLNQAYDSIVRDGRQVLEVRTYDRELVWHIILIDRQLAVLGFYGPGKSGWKWPAAIFDRRPRSFYYAIEEQFDQRWLHAKRVVPCRAP